MVITDRATRGERIPEPVVVFSSDAVRYIRECCGAFIGCDNQIGVVVVVTHNALRVHDFTFDDVVRNIEQRTNKGAVARFALFEERFALLRQLFANETTLSADRYNNRILNLLGFNQP